VASKLSRRLSVLQKHSEKDLYYRVRFFRAFLASFAIFAILLYFPIISSSKNSPEETNFEDWGELIELEVSDRISWLENSLLSFSLSGSKEFKTSSAETYFRFANATISFLRIDPSQPLEIPQGNWIDQAGTSIHRGFTRGVLRIGFLIIAFWPYWIVGLVAGYLISKHNSKIKLTTDFLGVCTKPGSVFYSGIYGPLKPNHGLSGIDYSCPSLATPQMVPTANAISHKLVATLKKYGGFNETNLELVRIILAYHNFPSYVEDEQPTSKENSLLQSRKTLIPTPSKVAFVSNEAGTLVQSSLEGLSAVLEAHKLIRQHVKSHSNPTKSHANHYSDLSKLTKSISPLGKILLFSLTPTRCHAIASISPQIVASAYLAIEAGKSLVYKATEGTFVRISRFPHLQARAVIQSIISYHSEYNGDIRLLIRQAIISSRRHRDFGRAFMPMQMPMSSRALRDWLEILYSTPDTRQEVANLVELDAYIDEVGQIWRNNFILMLEEGVSGNIPTTKKAVVRYSDNLDSTKLKKGLSYKSLVLIPLETVLERSLSGFDESTIKRIVALLKLTRDLQAKLSISARLPGFKRQASEALDSEQKDNIISLLRSKEHGGIMADEWLIVRRMLTKYNWLSTRIGDDPVPPDGLVQAILNRDGDPKGGLIGFDALVPIRQRRFREIFGSSWESSFYPDTPRPSSITIFNETNKYFEALEKGVKHLDTESNQSVRSMA
jgi:hypothetical protein